MDTNQLNSLDPKLREAYERIMGTATRAAASPNAQPAAPQTAQPEPSVPQQSSQQSTSPAQSNPAQSQTQSQSQQMASTQTTEPSNPSGPTASAQPMNAPQEQVAPMPPPQAPETAQASGNGPYNFPYNSQPAYQTAQVNNVMPNTQPAPQIFMNAPLQSSHADTQMHAYVAQEVAGVKQNLKIIQIIYIVAGIVFFLVYALFWIKFFNVSSPF